MKKNLIAFIFILLGIPAAYPSTVISPILCYQTCPAIDVQYQYDSSCTSSSACDSCKSSETQVNGVVEYAMRRLVADCSGTIVTCKCTTSYSSYTCASGYYGSPTNSFSGCTKCPLSATCSGGANPSIFVCNAGFYSNGTACVRCPLGAGNITATSPKGSTSLNSCYIPSGTSGSDASGSFEFTADCNYSG